MMTGETGFMNVYLQGESLPTDINAVLTPDNNHDASTFIDQIERAVQSNADVGWFKVQGFFICHIINYTRYNQK